MQAVKRLGQVDLKTGLAILGGLIAIGSTVWGYATTAGADKQRLTAIEARVERIENAVEEIKDRLPVKKR